MSFRVLTQVLGHNEKMTIKLQNANHKPQINVNFQKQ